MRLLVKDCNGQHKLCCLESGNRQEKKKKGEEKLQTHQFCLPLIWLFICIITSGQKKKDHDFLFYLKFGLWRNAIFLLNVGEMKQNESQQVIIMIKKVNKWLKTSK